MAQPTYEEWKQQRQADREQKYRAYEDSYRAYQAGDKSANLSVQFNQDDFDGWKQWRKQNASALDAEYTIKSLDQNVLSRVADQFKSQWGSKYYYDMFDPEDVARANAGQMPKYLDKSYNFSDPYDKWLYQNNLPSRKTFSDMYSQGVLDYQEEQEERYNRLDSFVKDWNASVDSYDRFQKDFIQSANEARKKKGSDLTDKELEDLSVSMLTSGKYDDVVTRFRQPTEEDTDKDAITLYIEQQNQPDYSAYDNALQSMQDGKDVDDSFFDSFKESDYKKWLAQKTAFTQQDLNDAYKLSLTKAEMARYNEYAEAIESGDTTKATKALDKIQTSVEDRMKESRFDKANKIYEMLSTQNEVSGSLAHIKQKTDEEFYADLLENLKRAKVSNAEEFVDILRERDILVAEKEWIKEQTDLSDKQKKVQEMASAAKSDPEFDKYASILIPRDENGFLNTVKMYTVGNEYDYLFDPQGYAQQYMKQDEYDVYAYYKNKFGDEKAQEYIDNITPVLYERSSAEDTEIVQNAYNMSPILASYAGTVLQPQTALEGYVTAAQSLFGGKLPEVNDPRFRTSRMAAEARQMVADTMTPTGQFFYQTGMSMLDNLARLPLKHAGLGVMAGSVFAQGTDQALQSGATPEQAIAIGASAAVIEVVTEKVSLENLMGIIKGAKGGALKNLAGNAKEIIGQALKQAGFEASEEMASEVLNLLANIDIMGDESEWEQLVQSYMQEGATRQQAEAKAFGSKALDTLIAGLGGAISGGVMGGGSTMLYNYSAGLKSGGNVVNALSVGTKAIAQYKQDAANAQKAGEGIQAQIIQDIGSIPVDIATKQRMIDVTGRLSQQPVTWMPNAALGVYRNFARKLNNLANRSRSNSAEFTAKNEKTIARLNALYSDVQTAYDEAKAALDKGDLRAHSAAMQKVQNAIETYKAAFSAAETENTVQETKKAEKEAAIANEAKAESEKLDNALEEATQYQKEKARTITRLEDLAELRDELAISEMSLEELDADLAEGNSYAIEKAADAMARRDVDSYNMWEDAVNYKDNPKDTENHLSTNENGDNFNVINEMVNGVESNETVQAKGETNAETGRDRVSRAESDLAQDARRGEEQNAGRARRDGAQASGTNRSAWGAQQEQDVTNAVAEYNRTHTKQMPVGSIRRAGKISEAVQKVADYIKGITGRDSFFVASDTDLIGGFQTNDRRYVVYTGDPMTDLFNLAHENGHSNKDFLDVIYAALDSGEIPNSSFQAYVRQRTENIARKQGITVSQVTESISQLREEFACDMFGLYMVERYFGTANWNQYGIPENSRQFVRNAFNEATQNIPQESSRQNNSLVSSRTYNDELYDSLLLSGAAITEQDALGESGVSFSENAFQFSENAPVEYADPFYSHMARVVENVKQEKIGASSVVNMLRGKGVKAEEIKWSGIEEWLEGKKSVTKQDLLAFINGNMLQIEETELADVTYYTESQKQELDEFSEQLQELFEKSSELWEKVFGEEMPLSFIESSDKERTVERKLWSFRIKPDGYRELLQIASDIDRCELSIQVVSDAAKFNDGSARWKRFALENGNNYREYLFKMPNSGYSNSAMKQHWGDHVGVIAHARVQDFDNNSGKMLFVEEIQSDWHNLGRTDGNNVPDAPFRNNYHEFVLKNLIRKAAENGYDSIGWTTAEIQSDRWSDEYAEGYRIEYDQDIPKFLNKYGKKWGTSVEKTDLNGTEIWKMDISDSMRQSVLYEGQVMFSENAPTTRQSRLNTAWNLYDDGYNPTEYYESNPKDFDIKTSNLLRGLMLRNGEHAGGALSDNEMQRVTDIFSRGKKRFALGLSISSPVRVFEDVTGWGGNTAEERAQNVLDGNYLKNTYYEYGNVQAANRETWIAEKMRPVIEAIKNNGDYGALESSITQMLGEGIITEDQAKNAVTDGKTMIVEVQDGVFVLDGKSRLLYSSDSKTSTEYTEEYRDRVKRAIKAGKGNRVNAFMPKPKTTENPLHVTRKGNTVTVNDANGKVVAEVTNGTKPNMKSVNAAVDALRTFYEDAYKEISNVRLENGYAPPGYIENYFPHQSRTYDGIEGFIEALTANDLPTAINGMTGTFSPGQPWNANLQTRLGTYTEFDAVRGFNRYVNGAGDTIFYTPVIQRLRQLEKAIRTQGANALTEEDAKRNSAFVDWLHEYANEWANKKSSFDRGAESIFGREAYSVSQMLTKLVSASAVGGNVSSAMSNIISGLTGYAQIDAKYTVPEIVRTVGQLFQLIDKKGQYDGFADKIPFLKRRFSDNEDILIQNMDKLKRKGSKALYAMFSAIDRFAVESVARAKYSECVANGMTDVQAIAATNDMLIKNFSDRGKGQAARVFNVKWLRPVAQFQLEVLNQMNHFRDMDRAEVEAKLADLEREYAGGIPFDELEVKALSSGGYRKLKKELAYLVLLSLWGIITRGLLGRDQTWNPYGMVKDAVEDIQEGGIKQAGEGIMEAVIDNAPFLSVLSGGGRVPIAGNLSYVTNVLEAVLNGESEKLTNADWIKGGTAFIPGGGQLRKTLTGIDANAQGGSYTDDGKLRYPISEDDFWRSAVFGPSAVSPDDYEWGTALSKKDTAVYHELVADGFDQSDLYDTLLNYGGSTNAERALSLIANRNDFSDDEIDVIAEAVGLNYKGSLEQYAEKEANKYLKKKQKELETGDISQESYDEIENVFDEYFRLLGMDN